MHRFQLFDFQIPRSVKIFTVKILLLFVLWEILYTTVLFPTRIPDSQITNITAVGTTKLLSILYNNDKLDVRLLEEGDPKCFKEIVFINDQKLIGIADGCNALELQVLYFGILICMQPPTRKTIWYSVVGVLLISVCNILRCCIIGWLNISRHLDLSVFAHHYLFKIFMYGCIFFAWVAYSNENTSNA